MNEQKLNKGEKKMKLRTKMAIFFTSVAITIVGFNLIASPAVNLVNYFA
jgi:hypothetical protein